LLNNLLFFVCLFLFVFYIKKINNKGFGLFNQWHFWILFIAFINYPLKGFVSNFYYIHNEYTQYFPDYKQNYIVALLLSQIAFIIGLITVIILRDQLYNIRLSSNKINKKWIFYFFFITLSVFFISFYKIYSGKFYGMSYEGGRTFIDNLIFNLSKLLYLTWYLSLAYFFERKNFKSRLILIIILSLITLDILLSTSKAPVLFTIVITLWQFSSYKKKFSLFKILISIILIITSYVYSYYSRYYFEISTSIDMSKVSEILSSLKSDSSISLFDFFVSPFFRRFELLDNLAIVISRSDYVNMGHYFLGTFVELLNVIPHSIWNDKPLLFFNYFVTTEVYQASGYWSSSVGRIGELYLVGGPFLAIMVFPILFVLFNFIIRILANFKLGNHKSDILIFVFFLFYGLQDDYFFQSAITFIFVIIFLITLKNLSNAICNSLQKKSRRL